MRASVAMVLLFALHGLARAEDEKTALAAEHLRRGVAAAEGGAFADAIDEYRATWQLSKSPDCLFFEAEVHRLKDDQDKAAAKYRAFLALVPSGRAADEARRYLAAHPKAAKAAATAPVQTQAVAATPAAVVTTQVAPPAVETPPPAPKPDQPAQAVEQPAKAVEQQPAQAPPPATVPPPPAREASLDQRDAQWAELTVRAVRRHSLISAGTGLLVVGAILIGGASVAAVYDNNLYSQVQSDVASGKVQTATNGCSLIDTADGTTRNCFEDHITLGRYLQLGAQIGFAVGGTMAGVGIALLLSSLAYRDLPPPEKKRAGLRLSPILGLGNVGLSGQF